MNEPVRRGEMYYADLNPVIGSEQGGVRPVLILQNDIWNHYSPTVVVAAITGKKKQPGMPTHYLLPAENGLEIPSLVLLEQIRTLDKTRLQDYIGLLPEKRMKGIDRAIAVILGMGT